MFKLVQFDAATKEVACCGLGSLVNDSPQWSVSSGPSLVCGFGLFGSREIGQGRLSFLCYGSAECRQANFVASSDADVTNRHMALPLAPRLQL